MNCDEVGAMLSAYADAEVDVRRRHVIGRHRSACAGCKAGHDAVLRLRSRIAAEVPYFVAPPALKARLQAMADVMAAPPKRAPPASRERWRWLGGGVFAGCAASAFAWV